MKPAPLDYPALIGEWIAGLWDSVAVTVVTATSSCRKIVGDMVSISHRLNNVSVGRTER